MIKQNRKREKQMVLRVTEKEYEKIKKKIEMSNLNQNEYLLSASLNKKITVIEGIRELTLELKRIGNNLNQLTKLAHEGRANCKQELSEIQKGLDKFWQSLKQLKGKIIQRDA